MLAMTPLSSHSDSGLTMRRTVRLQRSYTCPGCDSQHDSWARLSSCPDCGHSLSVAVIRRAALAGTP